ncbi:MAG: phosphoribosylformylglycinamidine cyclo-ligase [Eubacteriales bacterium]
MAITYKDSGVDVHAGYKAVALMKEHVKKTFDNNVLTDIGSFGGIYKLDDNTALVAGTDGVGTKLKLAFTLDKHDTIGIDCVAMCANDIVCSGAKPLLFLDYIATGKLLPENIAQIVKGVSDGCVMAGCALIGGETAEMPDFYSAGEYDIAGFCVGKVDIDKIIDGLSIKSGDALIGFASSGVHSNGYSLVRKLVPMKREALDEKLPKSNETIGEALLRPTKIYVKTILELNKKFNIKGISHITGGGFIENIPRMLPKGTGIKIDTGSWVAPPIIDYLVKKAELTREQAFNTFNMGIGMVLAVDESVVQEIISEAGLLGEKAYKIGSVTDKEGISFCE